MSPVGVSSAAGPSPACLTTHHATCELFARLAGPKAIVVNDYDEWVRRRALGSAQPRRGVKNGKDKQGWSSIPRLSREHFGC